MRLIDADALIPIMKYTTTDNEIGVFPIRIGFDAIKEVIDEAPTIEAVELTQTDTLMIADALRYLALDTERHLSYRTRADALRERILKYGASMCKGGDVE